jgi:ferredoxin-NADP reductase
MSSSMSQLRLHSVAYKADGVLEFELRDPAGSLLPSADPGAHIDLHLPDGLVRSYSLCNVAHNTNRYVIAVGLDANSRGGARYLHEKARVGSIIQITGPRNSFQLNEAAPRSLLIAGGIGITPLWSMAQRLSLLGRPWEMFYAARSRRTAAYVGELERLAHSSGAALRLHFDDVEGGPAELGALLRGVDTGTHAYCCGPGPMIEAFRAAAKPRLNDEQVHVEYFKAAKRAECSGESFNIRLRRSGAVLRVNADKSILDTLLDAGVDIPYSCMEGICGSCQLKVTEGIPDHRDSILSDRQRAANDVIVACCSRSKSDLLVLDL